MGRPDWSPETELEIKVQPRKTPHVGGLHTRHHLSPTPSLPSYQPFKKWFSWLVPSIAVVNLVLFVIAMYVNDCPKNSSECIGDGILGRFAFQHFRENPLLGPSAATLQKMGGLSTESVVEKHQVWRLLSSMWLHAGVLHLIANMFSLLFVGLRLEQEFGFVRIGLLYVLSAIGGSLLSTLFSHLTIAVGASGALFGFLGAMLSELIANWTIYESKIIAIASLLLIICINLAVGILPFVDNFAHIGGFITGFLLGFVLLLHPHFGWMSQRDIPSGYSARASRSKYKTYQYVLLVVSLILLITGFTTGLILVLQGVDGNKYCSWCHYLRCVPTPFWNCKARDARCTASQSGNQLNLTCLKNNNTKLYLDYGSTTAYLQKLCIELCS